MPFVCDEAIVLVGFGAPPADAPREVLERLARLEAERRTRGGDATIEERVLDEEIRRWPRTAKNDPDHARLAALALALAPRVLPARLVVAFRRSCAPSVDEVIDHLAEMDVRRVRVVPAERGPHLPPEDDDLEGRLSRARVRHPRIEIERAPSFDLDRLVDAIEPRLTPSLTPDLAASR